MATPLTIDTNLEKTEQCDDPGIWIRDAWHCHRHPAVALGRGCGCIGTELKNPDGTVNETPYEWSGAFHCTECNIRAQIDEQLAAPPVRRLFDPYTYRGVFDYPAVQCRRARFSLPSESSIIEAAADAALDALKVLRDPRRVERRVVIPVYGKRKGEYITYERGIVHRPLGLPELNESVALDIYLRAITPTINRDKVDALLGRFKPEWVGQRFEEFLSSLPERLEFEKVEHFASIDDDVETAWGGEEGDGTDTNGSAKHRSVRTEMMPDYEGFGYHSSPSSAEFKFAREHAEALQKIHIASYGVPHLCMVRRNPPLCPEDIDALVIETPDAVERQIVCIIDDAARIFPMRETPPNYLALQPDQKTPVVTYYEGKIVRTLPEASADTDFEPEPEKLSEFIDRDYKAITMHAESVDEETLTGQALGVPVESEEQSISPELASITDLFEFYKEQPGWRDLPLAAVQEYLKSVKPWKGVLPWWRAVPAYPISGPDTLWPESSVQLLPLRGRANKEEWEAQRALEKRLRANPEVKALRSEENKIWVQFKKVKHQLKGKWDEALYDLFMQATDIADKRSALLIEPALDGLFKDKGVWSRHNLTTTRVTSGTEEEQRDRNIHAAAEIGKFQQVISIVPRSKLAQEDVRRHLSGELSAEEVLKRNPGTTANMLKQARHNLRKQAAKQSNPAQRWARGLKNAKIDPDAPGIYALAQFSGAKERVYKIADVGDSDDAIWEKVDELVNKLVDTYIRKKGLPKIKTEICDTYRYFADDQSLTYKYIAMSELYNEYVSQLAVPTEWHVQPASESQLRALQARRHVLHLYYGRLMYLGIDQYLGIDLSSL
jgi:hypothetical protein